MPLTAGDKLGPYEIVGPLGEGGMGEVWKARDTRLNRTVAIKKSHNRFSNHRRRSPARRKLSHCSYFLAGRPALPLSPRGGP